MQSNGLSFFFKFSEEFDAFSLSCFADLKVVFGSPFLLNTLLKFVLKVVNYLQNFQTDIFRLNEKHIFTPLISIKIIFNGGCKNAKKNQLADEEKLCKTHIIQIGYFYRFRGDQIAKAEKLVALITHCAHMEQPH